MSRSYKKVPLLKDPGSKKWVKRQASKTVRRYSKRLSHGGSYKKLYDTWNINDYYIYEPWNVETQKEYKNAKYSWAKFYYCK